MSGKSRGLLLKKIGLEFVGTILVLASVAAAGLGLMMWLGDIQGEGNLNSTHALVRTTADWMVKSSIGAIVGFSTGHFAFRNERHNTATQA